MLILTNAMGFGWKWSVAKGWGTPQSQAELQKASETAYFTNQLVKCCLGSRVAAGGEVWSGGVAGELGAIREGRAGTEESA